MIVAARNEADRIAATLAALREALPGAALWVADDASGDGTAEAAIAAGAQVVSRGRPHGKGANVTAAAEAALSVEPAPAIVLLCDGDLGSLGGAARRRWSRRSRAESATSPSPRFSRRVGGGFGLALGFARWAIRRLAGGLEVEAPISGQRAMRVEVAAGDAALRPRLRDGDGDDDRRRPRAATACASTSSTSSTARPAAARAASSTGAASSPTSAAPTSVAEGGQRELGDLRRAAAAAPRALPLLISCWITAQMPPPIISPNTFGTAAPRRPPGSASR